MAIGVGIGTIFKSCASGSSYCTPQNLFATVVSDTAINLTWTGGVGRIERSTDGVNYTQIGMGNLSYLDTGLSSSTKYYYRVKGSNYAYSEYAVTWPSAIDDTNTVVWLDSTDLSTLTLDTNNYVSKWEDKLGSGRDLVQATGNVQPKYLNRNGVASIQEGTNLKAIFELNQPEFIYAVVERYLWESGNKVFFDGIDATHRMLFINKVATPQCSAYAGTESTASTDLLDNNVAVVRILFNGANSKLIINNNAPITGNFGVSNAGGLVLFNYQGLGAYEILGSIREMIIRKTADDAPTEANIYAYLTAKWSLPTLTEKFDGVFANSIQYKDYTTYKARNVLSNYSFYYSGNRLRIKAFPRYYEVVPTQNFVLPNVAIFINDVFYDYITFVNRYYMDVYLPEGTNKKITVIESSTGINQTGPEYYGTWITSILADASYQKINETVSSERLVFLGDSIMCSGYSLINITQTKSIPALFKIENSKDVGVYGWSGGQLADFASTEAKVNAAVAFIQSLLSTATDKKLIMAIGTNDHGVAGLAAATFQSYYEALLDAIHTADSDIKIWCISPLLRDDANENATLDDYRTRIAAVCTARPSYCTYIAGKTILSHPSDFYDYLHPNEAGHKKYKDVIYNAIY